MGEERVPGRLDRRGDPAIPFSRAARGGSEAPWTHAALPLIDLARDGRSAADLPRLIASAEAEGFDGLNITHPCKQAVLPLLDELSEDARAIGAVNTVVFRNGARVGFNTDCSGFALSFAQKLGDAARRRVVLLGAGGAGAAIAHAAHGPGRGAAVHRRPRPGARRGAGAQRLGALPRPAGRPPASSRPR